jgi:hypothetical protein
MARRALVTVKLISSHGTSSSLSDKLGFRTAMTYGISDSKEILLTKKCVIFVLNINF